MRERERESEQGVIEKEIKKSGGRDEVENNN